MYHDVDAGEAKTTSLQNESKMEYFNKAVKYILDNYIIEPNDSDWIFPCILVPKPNGSYRCCVYLKQVNTLSKSDS